MCLGGDPQTPTRAPAGQPRSGRLIAHGVRQRGDPQGIARIQSEVQCNMYSPLRQPCLNQSIIAWLFGLSHLPDLS